MNGIRLLSLDPGVTTGWVTAEAIPGKLPVDVPLSKRTVAECDKGYVRLLGWGLYSNLADRDTILTYLSGPLREPDVVVFEEYRVRPDKALQHIGSTVPTIEEIGRIKLWCFERDIVYVAQTAGQAKHRWPSERIRLHFPELAMYPSSTKIYADILNKHQVDALRHLLTYLEVTQGCEFWAPGLQPI